MTKRKSPVKKKEKKRNTVPGSIDLFVAQLESLSKSVTPTVNAISDLFKQEAKRFATYIKVSGIRKKAASPNTLLIPAQKIYGFERHSKSVIAVALAIRNVPAIYFIALVCQFDAYLGNLLRNLCILKPDILNSSQRQVTFSSLASFKSIEEARNFIIEREIESVLRESHAEHFDWMEKHFSVPLRKGLESWSQFIEITERRNLFVHCDGVITEQYKLICAQHGWPIDPKKRNGDRLQVTTEYFDASFKCLFEIGVKLGHVLWRKVKPSDIKTADKHLNDICYSLLVEERYDVAKRLLEFATNTLSKHSSDEDRRIFVINLGIALKNIGEVEQLNRLLDAEDWSSCKYVFALAVAVLKDDFQGAARIMKQIGRNNMPSKAEYADWPLFKNFRQSRQFMKAYKSIFHEDFKLEENKDRFSLTP